MPSRHNYARRTTRPPAHEPAGTTKPARGQRTGQCRNTTYAAQGTPARRHDRGFMNARRARERNRAERERLSQLLQDAAVSAPRYLETLSNGCEAWMRGRIMFVIPPLREDYPADLKAAVDRRRRASLAGSCDCGARWDLTRGGHLGMAHEPDCDAADEALDRLAAAHGMAFGRWAA
jgi:hypothetical protein